VQSYRGELTRLDFRSRRHDSHIENHPVGLDCFKCHDSPIRHRLSHAVVWLCGPSGCSPPHYWSSSPSRSRPTYEKAFLIETHLERALFLRTHLETAVLVLAPLKGAVADKDTSWPDGFDWRAAGVRLAGEDAAESSPQQA
jgi:hypothetical protein